MTALSIFLIALAAELTALALFFCALFTWTVILAGG